MHRNSIGVYKTHTMAKEAAEIVVVGAEKLTLRD
jgi:hypothetical protein